MRHKQNVKSRKLFAELVEALKVKSLKVVTLLTFVFSLSSATAQTSVNATGGDASGSGGSASYSVGQVAYQVRAGTNGSVSEGVQRPYEISVVTGIEEAIGINFLVSAYPNPATDYLQLKVESEKLKNLSYQLYNLNGKLLQNKKFVGSETQIDMSNYVPSTYFVKVLETSHDLSLKEVKTFKIIKN